VALNQQNAEARRTPDTVNVPGAETDKPYGPTGSSVNVVTETGTGTGTATTLVLPKELLKCFHGSVVLDAARVGRDAGRIADEVISHIEGLVGSKVTVTLEIEAEIPSGAPDHVVRTVTENSRTLKFTS
jgi:hypothetical protein